MILIKYVVRFLVRLEFFAINDLIFLVIKIYFMIQKMQMLDFLTVCYRQAKILIKGPIIYLLLGWWISIRTSTEHIH